MSAVLRQWLPALLRALEREPVMVRVVLAQVRGSAPREPGVGMLVGRTVSAGTIGGGQLEWEMLAAARTLLDAPGASAQVVRRVLAADLGQCCGGVVEVWLERFTRTDRSLLEAAQAAALCGGAVLISTLTPQGVVRRVVQRDPGANAAADRMLRAPRAHAPPRLIRTAEGGTTLLERLDDALPPVWLYGAGHVGEALARILTELPLQLTWVDSRTGLFPPDLTHDVRVLAGADPVATVAGAPPGARFVVITHSHALDYALCRTILNRDDFAWAGLIGSHSKAARFRARLARDGLHAALIARLVCPIGIPGIASKWPAAIAVGVAAQLLRDFSATATTATTTAATAATATVTAAVTACAPDGCASCGSAVLESV
jgi:xanthine dehydrogenase accessory factor